MKKILKRYGGAILFYVVIFVGVVMINQTFAYREINNENTSEVLALKH